MKERPGMRGEAGGATKKKDRADGPDVHVRIAGQVRALRAAQGLSLDGLAARSEVSRSMISLIERGESSPTAVVLDKIATGLGVPLARLFEDPAVEASPLSRGRDRTTWRDPDSGYLRRTISPSGHPAPFRISEVTLPARARVAFENGTGGIGLHQQIWVREGQVEVTVGRTTHRLGVDDCLAMQLDQPTGFFNRTRKPARYIVVVGEERAPASRGRHDG